MKFVKPILFTVRSLDKHMKLLQNRHIKELTT